MRHLTTRRCPCGCGLNESAKVTSGLAYATHSCRACWLCGCCSAAAASLQQTRGYLSCTPCTVCDTRGGASVWATTRCHSSSSTLLQQGQESSGPLRSVAGLYWAQLVSARHVKDSATVSPAGTIWSVPGRLKDGPSRGLKFIHSR